MPNPIESVYLSINNTDAQIHIKHFIGTGDVVFMVHGAIENGTIFYSKSNKGLAPFLAKHGFDVYVIDLRGRGQSTPAINKNSKHGQTESINQELPLALEHIRSLRPNVKQHWLAHSWGGPLINSLLARQPQLLEHISSLTYFGSKRSIQIKYLKRFIYIDLFWFGICKLIIKFYGYLPAKKLKFGADLETKKSHQQSINWVYGSWIDSDDGFNYAVKLKNLNLAPSLYLAAINDHVLGHPKDVERFMNESGTGEKCYILLGKNYGNLVNYDHINMLTHPLAIKDHFQVVLNWLKSNDS